MKSLALKFHFDRHSFPHGNDGWSTYQVWAVSNQPHARTVVCCAKKEFNAGILERASDLRDGARVGSTLLGFNVTNGGQCDLCLGRQILLRPIYQAAARTNLRRN